MRNHVRGSKAFWKSVETVVRRLCAVLPWSVCALLSHAQCPLAFAPPIRTLPVPISSLASGDFNRDNRTDAAGIHPVNEDVIRVLSATSNGSLEQTASYQIGIFGTSICAGDFDGDLRTDLVVAGNGVCILRCREDGTFETLAPVFVTSNDVKIAVGDLNGDGRTDIVASGDQLHVLLSVGDGDFVETLYSEPPGQVVTGDFDGNGRSDVVLFTNTGTLKTFLSSPDGGLSLAATRTEDASHRICSSDFNRDGVSDLAYGAASGVRILRGTRTGGFVSAGEFATGFGAASSFAIADVNGDGRDDLVAVRDTGTMLSVLVSNPSTALTWFQPAAMYDGGADQPLCVVPGDFNGDGRVDIAVGFWNVGLSVLLNMTMQSPRIDSHPVRAEVAAGTPASFSVASGSLGQLSFRWRKDGIPLDDGGGVSGTQTPVLSIGAAEKVDNGATFDCVVTNACTSVSSRPAGLVVTSPCAADFNGDDFLDFFDYDDFVTAFEIGC